MLQVTKNKVDFYFDNSDPLLKMAYKLCPEELEKAVIEVDLYAIFDAIADKYGIGTCADLVQKAMEAASDDYKKDA